MSSTFVRFFGGGCHHVAAGARKNFRIGREIDRTVGVDGRAMQHEEGLIDSDFMFKQAVA